MERKPQTLTPKVFSCADKEETPKIGIKTLTKTLHIQKTAKKLTKRHLVHPNWSYYGTCHSLPGATSLH